MCGCVCVGVCVLCVLCVCVCVGVGVCVGGCVWVCVWVRECWSVRVHGGADEQSEVERSVVKLLEKN